ncbi:MAG TPA: hypothetical protein VG734_26770 [Lacunisphaera sp.]|nr:hypothetical protein [Lacunisphaera sp.]
MVPVIKAMPRTRCILSALSVQSAGLLMLSLGAAALMRAQDIISSIPRAPAEPSVLRDQLPAPPPSVPPAPPQTPFKLGSLVLRPHLSYSYMNAEGLPAADGRRVASEIFTLSAGLTGDLGKYWTFDYSPSWRKYSARAMMDSDDLSASLKGMIPLPDMGLQFAEIYSQSTPTLVETGQQTKQESWTTSLNTAYRFSPGIQLQASGGMNERYTDIAPDMRTWNANVALNLAFSPRFSLNVGPSFSYNEIKNAADLYDEGYQAEVSWKPTDKITLAFTLGRQYSYSKSSAGINLSNPILNFMIGYQPFETTTLTFSAARTTMPSYFGDQVTDTSRWSVILNQRLLGRFYLNASYAPYDNSYTAIDLVTPAGRVDSVKSYNVSLSTQLFGRISFAATYTLTKNDSNVSGFTFSTTQYGVQLGCNY